MSRASLKKVWSTSLQGSISLLSPPAAQTYAMTARASTTRHFPAHLGIVLVDIHSWVWEEDARDSRVALFSSIVKRSVALLHGASASKM